MDHDWVYRQLFLYELGGLSDYVRRAAAPDLLVGADHIHDWAKTAMTALRLVERQAGTIIWECVETGDNAALPNIGSAAMVIPGEHVIGRLVPIEDGMMLEGTPLVVPECVARQVADDPASWIDAVAEAGDDVVTGGFEIGVVDDVRQLTWQYALYDPSGPVPGVDELEGYLARKVLALAWTCLDGGSPWEPDEVDPWACLRAAVLDLGVIRHVVSLGERRDAEAFDRLSQILASPADVVCGDLARELCAAA
jgi:hypothetical protein